MFDIPNIPKEVATVVGYLVIGAIMLFLVLRNSVKEIRAIILEFQKWVGRSFYRRYMAPIRRDIKKVIEQQQVIIETQDTHTNILTDHSTRLGGSEIKIAILQGKVLGGEVELDSEDKAST